jgi:regulator of sigma E protease
VDQYLGAFVLIAGISGMILFHELGHFVVARCCGVRVDRFSVGLGREVFGFVDRYETRWSIAAIPYAGFVRFYGPGEPSQTAATNRNGLATSWKPIPYERASTIIRLLIVLAGPLFSLVFAYLVTFANYYLLEERPAPVVGKVMSGSPAEKVGLSPGDRILSVDGRRIVAFEDIRAAVNNSTAPTTDWKIIRNGEIIDVTITPTKQQVIESDPRCNHDARMVGIGGSGQMIAYTPLDAAEASGVLMAKLTVGTLAAFWPSSETRCPSATMIRLPGGVNSLSPPLTTVAIVSMGYGALNLMPFRMLDGAELLALLLALVRGRPLRQRTQERIGRVMLTAGTAFFAVASLVKLLK